MSAQQQENLVSKLLSHSLLLMGHITIANDLMLVQQELLELLKVFKPIPEELLEKYVSLNKQVWQTMQNGSKLNQEILGLQKDNTSYSGGRQTAEDDLEKRKSESTEFLKKNISANKTLQNELKKKCLVYVEDFDAFQEEISKNIDKLDSQSLQRLSDYKKTTQYFSVWVKMIDRALPFATSQSETTIEPEIKKFLKYLEDANGFLDQYLSKGVSIPEEKKVGLTSTSSMSSQPPQSNPAPSAKFSADFFGVPENDMKPNDMQALLQVGQREKKMKIASVSSSSSSSSSFSSTSSSSSSSSSTAASFSFSNLPASSQDKKEKENNAHLTAFFDQKLSGYEAEINKITAGINNAAYNKSHTEESAIAPVSLLFQVRQKIVEFALANKLPDEITKIVTEKIKTINLRLNEFEKYFPGITKKAVSSLTADSLPTKEQF